VKAAQVQEQQEWPRRSKDTDPDDPYKNPLTYSEYPGNCARCSLRFDVGGLVMFKHRDAQSHCGTCQPCWDDWFEERLYVLWSTEPVTTEDEESINIDGIAMRNRILGREAPLREFVAR
jgi:hypothetical protein